ncbi:hypothetical protein ACSBOB_00165 [Mesorhizobium sp. ASY16-5R]|uniref:hypothetical protein n=1 Tax=Mesorhizobium sp. ASY16-5R TaxID=3445772 RepID=UPI003F9FFE38
MAVARLFERAGIDSFDPRLGFLHDSAYLTLDFPGQAESGFEVILRENPFQGRADDPVITVSALTAEPLPGDGAGRSRAGLFDVRTAPWQSDGTSGPGRSVDSRRRNPAQRQRGRCSSRQRC